MKTKNNKTKNKKLINKLINIFTMFIITSGISICISCNDIPENFQPPKNITTGDRSNMQAEIIRAELQEENNQYIYGRIFFKDDFQLPEYSDIEIVIDDYKYPITTDRQPEEIQQSGIMFSTDRSVSDNPFGKKKCVVKFLDQDNVITESYEQTINLNIQTWRISASYSESHENHDMLKKKDVELFSNPRALGSWDLCWMYEIRVPHDAKIRLTTIISAVPDNRPAFNNAVLQTHWRLADWRNRNDDYENPDCSIFHIDPEKEKWVEGESIELEHGNHVIYVVQSVPCDMSYLSVYHTTERPNEESMIGSVNGFIKSIDWDALGYPEALE